MDNILFLAWLIWPPLSWQLWRRTRYRKIHWVFVVPFVTLVAFVLIFLSLIALDARETAEVMRYDTNHDGSFSSEEMTPAAKEALSDYTNDASRLLAWMLTLPVSLIWVGIVYLSGALFLSVRHKPDGV